MSEQNSPEQSDFDAIIGAEFDDDDDMTTIAELSGVITTLQARITAYEASAKIARHAFRGARKATSPQEVNELLSQMRDALRAIHPTTEVF
jgi:hypothetical protein